MITKVRTRRAWQPATALMDEFGACPAGATTLRSATKPMPISVRVILWIMMLGACTGLIYNLCEYVRFLDSSDWTPTEAIVVSENYGRNAPVYQLAEAANGFKTSKIGFGIATRFSCCLKHNQKIRVMASPGRDRATIYREYIGENWFVNVILVVGALVCVAHIFGPRDSQAESGPRD